MAQAKKPARRRTKQAAAEKGSRLMDRIRQQTKALTSLKGLGWEGDPDEMRRDRSSRSS
jgi:hypothetical protein